DWAQKVSAVAKKVYQVLQMKGFSRSEYIFVNGEPHLLEVNTVPGLTEQSLLPQQAEKAGIRLEELFDNAIQEALK
ncbi:MAG: D-alanine--D-alanine ligase, partial [Bacteroidetes bacterium HGW-Bacteroidetes-13]